MNGGLVPGLPSTAAADTAHEVQEREQARLRERERAQATRDRRDEEFMQQANPHGNVFMAFSISDSGPELLLL
jgi:hypothetical protein